MAIVGLFFGLFWLVAGYFITRWILRLYLGSVHKAGKGTRTPFQFSVSDIYVLTVQIGIFALPLMQLEIPIDERAGLLVALTLYMALSWILCCRALSSVKIRKAKPRIAAILVFPFQLASASVFGFGWLHCILLMFLSMPMLGAGILFATFSLLVSAMFSDWLMTFSEMVKVNTLAMPATEGASKDIVSESQVNKSPEKELPPPDAFPRS